MEVRRKPRRGDLYWVNLDPTVGTEIRKTRPAVILSNNAQNEIGQRVLAAPVTSNTSRVYSFEALLQCEGKPAKAMLDQCGAWIMRGSGPISAHSRHRR